MTSQAWPHWRNKEEPGVQILSSKARLMLFMIRQSFRYWCPRLSPFITRWFGPILRTPWRPACERRLFGANLAVDEKARKGFPPTAIWETTTSAGSALLNQASPPWRPHSWIQSVFWRIRSGPQALLYSANAARLERSSFTVIHNHTNFKIVLYHITFFICGNWSPLWSTVPLCIVIITY